MPSCCCIPGCRSNYGSSLRKVQNHRGISVFQFPKNEERKQTWLKAISRKDFVPSSYSVVCQLHFESKDIILYDKYLQPDGSCTELLLSRPRLKADAVPCVFPNLPANLSKRTAKKRIDPEFRRATIAKDTDMNSETFAIREPNEELTIKDEHSGELILNRIEIEHCEELAHTKLIEQTNNDQNFEPLSGTLLNSIKSEPDDLDCHVNNRNIHEIKAENNELGMEMDNEYEEEMIKNEYDKNVDATSEIVLNRIKNEYVVGESEQFRVTEITEEFIIKSESETNMDVVSDIASNSMAKSKYLRNQHQVASKKRDRKSFSCYNCNHTAYSKRNLISHMKVHNNQKYVHISRPAFRIHTCIQCHVTFMSETALDDHTKRIHSNVESLSNKNLISVHSEIAEKLSLCIYCNATFKNKISLYNHVIKKHPDFVTSLSSKLYGCTVYSYTIDRKDHVKRHKSVHSKTTSKNKPRNCTHCDIAFKNKRGLDEHVVKKHPNLIASLTNKLYECTYCIYKTTRKYNFDKHNLVHSKGGHSHRKKNARV